MSFPSPTAATGSDFRCAGCGYNLHGLPEDSRCPECGKPVAISRAGDPMHAADERWRRSLRRGAVLLAIVLAASVPIEMLHVYRLVRGALAPAWPKPPLLQWMDWARLGCDLGTLIAVWLLMTPEPRWAEPGGLVLGWTVRLLTLIQVIGASATRFFEFPSLRALQAEDLAVVLLGLVQLVLFYERVTQLAERTSDHGLARGFRVLQCLKPIARAGSTGVALALYWSMRLSLRQALLLPTPGYLLNGALNAWAIVLLVRFARALYSSSPGLETSRVD